jgi:hypothetical protein
MLKTGFSLFKAHQCLKLHIYSFALALFAIEGFWQGAKEATPICWGWILGLGDKCGRDLGVHHAKMLGFCNTHTKVLYSRGSRTKALCFCIESEGVASNSCF